MLRLATFFLITIGPSLAMASPCYQITRDQERLACYDRMATCFDINGSKQRLACLDEKVRNGAEPESAHTSAPSPARAKQPPVEQETVIPQKPSNTSRFGLPPSKSEQMSSTIVKVFHRLDGIDFITLANHQIWRETEDQTDRFKVGEHVTIKPGIFGSYSLQSDALPGIIKVQRLK